MISRGWNPRALVLLLGLAAYGPASLTGFLYDDHILIESNAVIQSGCFANLRPIFTSGVFRSPGPRINFYRPLQTLSTCLEHSLWGLHPFPYHLTNLLLHIGCAWLLLELVLALGFGALTATLASSLFVVHPIIVEPLLMVSGRGEMLGFFFSLGCILLFLRQTLPCILLSLASYALALLSKESALITPLLLALVLYYKREPLSRYRILIPMAGITALYLGLRNYALGEAGLAWSAWHPGRFFLMAFPEALIRYGRILLFPLDLHTDRLFAPVGPTWVLSTAALLASICWVLTKAPRWVLLCFFWYLLNLLPKSVMIMSGSYLSDHWAYPALPALTLPIAMALARYWTAPERPVRLAARTLCAFLLLAEGALAQINVLTRNTDEKLYRSALRYPTTTTMKYNLGMTLFKQGRTREALPYFESLYRDDLSNVNAGRALAASYWKDGQRSRAVAVLDALARRDPHDTVTRQLLQQMKRRR